MKKLLPLICAAVMILCAGCGKRDNDAASPAPPKSPAAVSAAPSAKAPPSGSPAVTGEGKSDKTGGAEKTRKNGDKRGDEEESDGTQLERLEPEAEPEPVSESAAETAFEDVWRATGTTSENAAFSSLQVSIDGTGYSVSISFDDDTPTVTYDGTYTIEDGVLTFDENFEGCTAYFYEDDSNTLVLDNGSSLVFCEPQEEEKDM